MAIDVKPERKPLDNEIDVFGLTNVGLVRPLNQDHFLIATLGRELRILRTSLPDGLPDLPVIPDFPETERAAFLAIVADGVGGSANGEEASRVAVEEVTSHLARSLQHFYTTDTGDEAKFREALEEAARQSHAHILERAAAEPTNAGMATTLTLFLGVWPYAYLLQIGDSRYYLLRNGELTQVSRDQTVAQDLVDTGVLTPGNAQHTRWAHVLSSALGGPNTSPSVTRVQNDWNSVHLLCSDGLTKHVSDERIRDRLMTMTSAQKACEDLLQDALDDGGRDNITIIVGQARSGIK
jgi:serine/threonine protein phosphatase PrpC